MRSILAIIEILLEHPVRAIRWGVRTTDRAIIRIVKAADHGVAGFVHGVERRVSTGTERTRRVFGGISDAAGGLLHAVWRGVTWPLRAAVRWTDLAVAHISRAMRNASRGSLRAIRTLAADVASLSGAFFGAPARSGRAVEGVVYYWLDGIWRLLARVVRSALRPIRKRQAERARQEAGLTAAMTPDHHAYRELLLLGAVAALLAAGAFLLLGGREIIPDGVSQGFRGISLEAALDTFSAISPLRLIILVASLVLSGVATLFWLRMLRDSYRREYPTAIERTQWRMVTTLFFIPGAVWYFFKQYNRLPLRRFAARHVLSLMVTGMAVLVATSTYGSLWYLNQQAEADVSGAGYQAPDLQLDPDDRQEILSRDKYGAPLRRATDGRPDPFAPLPGEGQETPTPGASPSPSPSPQP